MTFDIGLHEVCVRTGVRYVMTNFSGMASLPNFLTHGAPLRARELRYYHCYLSILASLSIEIIDSLADCRVDSIS